MLKIKLAFVIIILFSLSSGANSASISINNILIESSELKSGTDISKTKLNLKNAVVKFEDGSIYTGPIKKNKFSGKGKLTLKDGTVYEGKFKSNKFIHKKNKKNRTLIKLNLKKGIKVNNQIKVQGLPKWYPADVVGGEFKISKKGELMASQDKKAASGAGSGSGSGC